MRARIGVPLTLVVFGVYIFAMMTLNKHIGVYEPKVAAEPTVAGVTTEKELQFVPARIDPLSTSISTTRVANGHDEVIEDVRLNAVAFERATDMVARGYYAHESPDKKNFVDLFNQNGIANTTYACENLLLTQTQDPTQAVTEWLASPSHKACMNDALMTRVGVASLTFDSTTGQRLYVAIFAQR